MTSAETAAQRRALGDFLRTHRARLTPALVGLPVAGRRRTPGLRREEVALLCGISTTWYTWLEQGRDVSMSPGALARLARTLHLTRAERIYLFGLAGKPDPDEPADAASAGLPRPLLDTVSAIAWPAYLLDRMWAVRAWNAPAAHLFHGWLGRDDSPNLLRFMFLDPAARALVCDWPIRARRLVAEFRADFGRHLTDLTLVALVEDLCRHSVDFAREWQQHAVVVREGGERTFRHPIDGFMRFEQLTFTPADQPDIKLVLLAPAEAAGESPPPPKL
jgi:transcriptional regulator with XRE-family HTH domain